MINPDAIRPGTVIQLSGRNLTFRQRRFQDACTVWDCVDSENLLRTVSRSDVERAVVVYDPFETDRERVLRMLTAAVADLQPALKRRVRGVKHAVEAMTAAQQLIHKL